MEKQINQEPVAAAGSSPQSAASVMATVKTTIERGDAYLSPQLYNVEVTLLQFLRGKEAGEQVRARGITDNPPQDGYEYLLANIRVGYFRRVRGLEDEPYTLTEGQFAAVSPDGITEYTIPAVSRQPQPPLVDVTFNPGDTREGWILLQVPQDEKTPFLVYKRKHVEGNYGIWGYIWFKLF